jgi:DMSO/TMAO reductase YedYZ molybdopterin-dependent catalytic subunit
VTVGEISRRLGRQVGVSRDRALARPTHDERAAAVLGIALGVCFFACFLTGLYSHLLQHPVSWLRIPSRPAGLYRVTQGVHVATGLAAIPLLLAKLWSVAPRLFRWPPVPSLAVGVERALLVPLVCGAVLQLFTGTANIARWYPWPFFFTTTHYWVAWITIGALVAHTGAKAHTTRGGLRRRGASITDERDASDARDRTSLSRRAFLGAAGGGAAVFAAVTAGQTFPPLRRVVLFAPRRPDIGPEALPVNRAAAEAGVIALATDPGYRLTVTGAVDHPLALSVSDLEQRAQSLAELPIACVEGWSRSARWSGVRIRDLLDDARLCPGAHGRVKVHSLEPNGLYARSTLEPEFARDRDTLLALHLNGERLDLDHGYPCRLIAPNRPGVLQTKWVTELVVS